jgi:hypothetical protein
MEQKLIIWLVSFLVAALWGLVIYLLKKNQSEIKCLQKRTEDQELKLQTHEGKLWSETKLSTAIESAVDKSLLRFENKMLKEGLLHTHTRRSTNK